MWSKIKDTRCPSTPVSSYLTEIKISIDWSYSSHLLLLFSQVSNNSDKGKHIYCTLLHWKLLMVSYSKLQWAHLECLPRGRVMWYIMLQTGVPLRSCWICTLQPTCKHQYQQHSVLVFPTVMFISIWYLFIYTLVLTVYILFLKTSISGFIEVNLAVPWPLFWLKFLNLGNSECLIFGFQIANKHSFCDSSNSVPWITLSLIYLIAIAP